MKRHTVLGVEFDVVRLHEAVSRTMAVLTRASYSSQHQVVTPNPEMLLEARKNSHVRNVLNSAWMSIPDGVGILWAAVFNHKVRSKNLFVRGVRAVASLFHLLIHPHAYRTIFPERVTGTDLMEVLCRESSQHKIPIFLLGAGVGVAEQAEDVLQNRYPGINIVGTYEGNPSHEHFPIIKEVIHKAKPHLLFVAYGAPRQELWIARHLKDLPSVRIAIGVGGAFDYIAGKRHRPHPTLRALGLEWLGRLIQQPSRIKRIWNAVVRFPIAVIMSWDET